MNEIEKEIKEIMGKTFVVPTEQITDESSVHSISGWSSIKHMDLILSLEDKFDIIFEEDEIPTLLNYKIIFNTIISYLE